MTNCPTCGALLPLDRIQLGARCPTCHDPLYEPPGRMARISREGEATCYMHAGMVSVGECVRCKHRMCETCRTRWHGQLLCSGCVDRVLSSHPTGEFDTPRLRHAKAGAYLGALTWVLGIVGVI